MEAFPFIGLVACYCMMMRTLDTEGKLKWHFFEDLSYLFDFGPNKQ